MIFQFGCGRGRRLASLMLFVFTLVCSAGPTAHAFELTSTQKRASLSPRQQNFLNFVFAGDEGKAVEYAKETGINPNSIGGQPLSTWFYGLGPVANVNVQRIVFERFQQNPNPPHVGDMEFLGAFCNIGALPGNIRIAVQGSPAEKAALKQRQDDALRAYTAKIVASFQSLLGYGLKNRAVLTRLFVGCLANRTLPQTIEIYDLVLAPMLKAGANIDGDETYRPLLSAVQSGNSRLVERLVADGADVVYHMPSPSGIPFGQGPCQPRADQSLYRYELGYSQHQNNEEAALRIIRALASKGLSPLAKWGYEDRGRCIYTTLYDAALDTGNMAYAAKVKDIGETVGKSASMASNHPSAGPSQQSSSPTAAASQATTASTPAQFGAWRVVNENGKLVAMAKSAKLDGGHIAGIRFECAAPGRLEYVPVALLGVVRTLRTLWVNGMNDTQHTIPLRSGRVAGADNSFLSKEFLGSEANYKRNGEADWGIEMSVEGPDAGMETIRMAGFSQMRSYMLANCKR